MEEVAKTLVKALMEKVNILGGSWLYIVIMQKKTINLS